MKFIVLCPICGKYYIVSEEKLFWYHVLMRDHVRCKHDKDVPEEVKTFGWTDRIVIVIPMPEVIKIILDSWRNTFEKQGIPVAKIE